MAIYPNNDSGSDVILAKLRELEKQPALPADPVDALRVFPRRLLKHAKVIVGNSSAGIREAPVYGVPTVNIGTRQNRRFRHPSILDVPEERGAILAALADLPKAVPPSLHFGNGDSARQFLAIVEARGAVEHPASKALPRRQHAHFELPGRPIVAKTRRQRLNQMP